METFCKLFGSLLALVYHCFDRIVIQGYLPLLTRPEHIVHFFRDVARHLPDYQAGLGQADPRVPAVGRSFRPQPPHSPPVARKRHQERRLCPTLRPGHGTSQAVRRLLHLQEPGTRPHLPFVAAQVPHR